MSDGQYNAANYLVSALIHFWKHLPHFEVVSGGAPGVDTIAHQAAIQHEVRFKIFFPNNHRWEPDGFKERNTQIAMYCDSLIRVSTTDCKTYGSGWTADYAEQLGKPVMRYWV